MNLLTSNTKLGKAVPGYRILGLSLLPGIASGREVCPGRGACYATCLAWAGRSAMAGVRAARKARTDLLFEHPTVFAAQMDRELLAHTVAAIRHAEKPAVRLNVLSDVDWREHPAVYRVLRRHADGGVLFYDYTKRRESPDPRIYGHRPRVCYSWSERAETVPAWAHWVAVVTDPERPTVPADAWPTGGQMSDGDAEDLFFLRPPGVQILSPKGKARGSEGPFVARAVRS